MHASNRERPDIRRQREQIDSISMRAGTSRGRSSVLAGIVASLGWYCLLAFPFHAEAGENLCRSLAGKYSENPNYIQTDELRALAACIESLLIERTGTGTGSAARRGAVSAPAQPPVRITREKQRGVSVGPAFDPDSRIEYLCLEPRDLIGFDPAGARVTIKVNKYPGFDIR